MTTTARAVESAIVELKRVLGARANETAAVREHHSHGESYHAPAAPDVVCYPATLDEVVEIVRISARFQVPIVPFGAGTSLEGHVQAGGLQGIEKDASGNLYVVDAIGNKVLKISPLAN